ncbi:MAG: T9SS C-terminal target domain-containing protein [Chitinophagaceae bacterium]|nr:MAG: T9SS C-terminal target domain-containing protein [Chitinophagaceae bacterium]
MQKLKLLMAAIIVLAMTGLSVQQANATGSVYAGDVALFEIGTLGDGSPVTDPTRTDPDAALGEPVGDNSPGSFVSIGFGGILVLEFSDKVANNAGDDFRIVEVTNGNPDCSGYPERAEIWVSQDNVDFYFIEEICLDADLDISNAQGLSEPLSWIKFVKIIDVTDASEFSQSPSLLDGYDVDGIVGFAIYEEPKVGEECFIAEVVEFNPGFAKYPPNNNEVLADRLDTDAVLGEPSRNNAAGEFISLGFGGDVTVKFGDKIKLIEGEDDVIIWETSFGDPSCSAYPETADVYVSQNGTDFYFVTDICLTVSLDLNQGDVPAGWEWIQYIKLVDTSNPNSFSTSPNSDGYDLDGIECLNGFYVEEDPKEPEPEPDYSCGKKGNKTLVCHRPPGQGGNKELTLCVGTPAVPAFLAIGGSIGPCNNTNRIAPQEAEKLIKELPGEPVVIDNMVAAYPNPFRETVNIVYVVPAPGNSEMHILDINGRTVKSNMYTHTRDNLLNDVSVDLSNHAPGIYLVKIVTEDDVFTYKIQSVR